mmetsp:Transcript_21017/g.52262  ORF Transcript_21017/g.52262 Transcript_21017/m.52262 type:complete len:447 (+) Transcript_21017:93-1433(+)
MVDFLYDVAEPFSTALQRLQQLQNDFAEAIQRSELDTWTFTKEVDNPELQGLARIRGHLDVMAQQLSALGEIEEAHKAEKNVVLEKLERARVELLTAIDAAIPRISHERTIVQAALDFVELPGDRERLRSPGDDINGHVCVSEGRDNNTELYSLRLSDPVSPLSKPAPLSICDRSVADTAPRNLKFTDVDSAEDQEDEADRGKDDDDDYHNYKEIPGSGWVVAGFLTVILGVGLHVNRKHLGVQVRTWRADRQRAQDLRASEHAECHSPDSSLIWTNIESSAVGNGAPRSFPSSQASPSSLSNVGVNFVGSSARYNSQASTPPPPSRYYQHQPASAQRQVSSERDSGVLSLTASERTVGQSDAPQVGTATKRPSTPPRQRPTPVTPTPASQNQAVSPVLPSASLESSPPRSLPRPPSPLRTVISSGSVANRNRVWRWRPHVLLGRG